MWRFVLPRVATAMMHRQHPKATPRSMMHARHVSFFFAMAAVATLKPIVTLADVNVIIEPPLKEKKECPVYGCPLLPQDIYYDDKIRESLEAMRSHTKKTLSPQLVETLESSGNHTTATLTLIGYKGGSSHNQINQDRALVVSPFRVHVGDNNEADDGTGCRLLGVFDGHAPLGEGVSDYVVTELPKLLSKKLQSVGLLDEQATKQALIETFIHLDKTAPADKSGGCTASVILQLGHKIYVANAGDSISFVAVYHKRSKKTQVVYNSREDKPDLPEERKRVERMGGRVYIPDRPGATSRVLYQDPLTGETSGLAMSRSIGDWEAGKVGVIPDPIVDVIHIPNLVEADGNMCVVIDEYGNMNTEPCATGAIDDVHIFAVSATDGLMDFLDTSTIAQTLGPSLFDEDGSHPLTACEMLISTAASGWQMAKQGRYRDDIAIAVSTIRIPPSLRKGRVDDEL